ncbi:hypothetical protein V6N13_099888 [Hibiscus sabdariffa]
MLQFAKSLVSKGLDVSLVTFCGNKPMAVQDYSSVKLDDPGANNLLQKKRRQLPQAVQSCCHLKITINHGETRHWPVSTVFYMVGLPLLQAHDLPSFVYDIQVVNWMSKQRPIKTIAPTIPSKHLDERVEDDNDYGFHSFKPEIDICVKWLNSKQTDSVVYMSFGSLATLGLLT